MKVPVVYEFDYSKCIGQVQIDALINGDLLKGMCLAPAYTIDKDGKVEITSFGLIKGENYNPKP